MALLQWSADLGVGVAAFDNHHKRLVDLINELHDAMLAGKTKDVVGGTLKGLRDYTAYHFGEEEKLMLLHSYPGYKDHKAEHDKFVKKVGESIDKYERGSIGITVDLMNFLKDWLKGHIKSTDRRYSEFFGTRKVA